MFADVVRTQHAVLTEDLPPHAACLDDAPILALYVEEGAYRLRTKNKTDPIWVPRELSSAAQVLCGENMRSRVIATCRAALPGLSWSVLADRMAVRVWWPSLRQDVRTAFREHLHPVCPIGEPAFFPPTDSAS